MISRLFPFAYRAALVFAVACTSACVAKGEWRERPATGRREGSEISPRDIEYHPRGPAARRYNEALRPARLETPFEERVAALVLAQSAGTLSEGISLDRRLCAVAKEAARLAARELPLDYAAVELALSHHGLIEPSPYLIVLSAAAIPEEEDVVLDELRARLPQGLATGRFTRLGVALEQGAANAAIVIALQESFVCTEPVPRLAQLGEVVSLRGKLVSPFREPQVLVTQVDGQVQKVPILREDGGGFRAKIPCGDKGGRLQVEIVGNDASGATVLANFPIYCGDATPPSVRLIRDSDPPVHDAAQAERTIFELANSERRAVGLSELAWDDRAASVARAHSVDMRDSGVVAHVLPSTGSAADRVQRAGIRTPLVLENLARAFSPREAHLGLMNSPGHRANLLSEAATHLGVGVALGRDVAGRAELYVTEVFFRVPPKLDAQAARSAARKALAEKRARAGLAELSVDPELDLIAQEHAATIARGGSRESAAAVSARRVEALAGRFRTVVTIVAVVGDPEDAAATEAVKERAYPYHGLGVAQGHDPHIGDGAVFVVVLLAK
ncbi:MAG: hypothetical protein HY698_13325 [Deltaproteobacteria bacterium]|nr:hypothetical protein [Deltaproteobacteria bacterium]